ncbi:hypothetical protein RE432_03935 [Pusillimonas sp. SM2304]|uniref:AtuA-related protein n=1 Tax=Pusillimonas sp. SM2304 TaxID=3073241 RepID=UPI0028771FB7|nr:hypothetical protein [Pusillimonas sp. SM2304]MDS1139575.1 hypothetical protein [Pusillimonas sp. SM2304]
MKVLLQHVAHARSGDKGNTSNISVFAYEPEFYDLLKTQLTAERLKAFYRAAIKGEVLRYEVDNIQALNFVAHGALGGGVSRSLCLDNYGKALSAAILGFEIEVPDSLAHKLHGQHLLKPVQRVDENLTA